MTTEANPKRAIRKTRGAWTTARRITQYLALAFFILLLINSRQEGWPAQWVNLPIRLDPLAMLANFLASRSLLVGSAMALIVVALTIVAGRAWCGWLCPLGTTLDLFPLHRVRKDQAYVPEKLRSLKYGLLFVILVAALLGNLTLLMFDPLTIVFRTLTVSIWPPLDQLIALAEKALYQVPFLSDAVGTFDQWIRPQVFPLQPLYYRDTILFAAVFVGVILSNWLAPRFWCRYICPLGALLGFVSKIAIFRRQVSEECKGCKLCTNVCPTGTIDPARNYASDPSECTMCMDCLEVCPRSTIAFKPGLSLAEKQPYDPGRREVLLGFGSALAGVALFNRQELAKRDPSHLIRPPGAREINPDPISLTNCVRCGECMRACPTGGLQPSIFEAGLQGLWTPVLLLRLGYCDYSCNACGQVCPAQAIPPLSLEEKRLKVLGKAYIDENRCIAWSDHKSCIVCEEMCPLPQKAIQLEESTIWSVSDPTTKLKLPHVLRDRCIGCGICEYKCPVNGDAAIRVYVPPASTLPF